MATKMHLNVSHARKDASWTAQGEDTPRTWILAQLKVQVGRQMVQPCHSLGTAGCVQGYATTQQGLQTHNLGLNC